MYGQEYIERKSQTLDTSLRHYSVQFDAPTCLSSISGHFNCESPSWYILISKPAPVAFTSQSQNGIEWVSLLVSEQCGILRHIVAC